MLLWQNFKLLKIEFITIFMTTLKLSQRNVLL